MTFRKKEREQYEIVIEAMTKDMQSGRDACSSLFTHNITFREDIKRFIDYADSVGAIHIVDSLLTQLGRKSLEPKDTK